MKALTGKNKNDKIKFQLKKTHLKARSRFRGLIIDPIDGGGNNILRAHKTSIQDILSFMYDFVNSAIAFSHSLKK